MKTVDFSETIEACDLKVGRYRQLLWKNIDLSHSFLAFMSLGNNVSGCFFLQMFNYQHPN